MTANEKRIQVRDKYKIILGRNKYSQSLRNYVNTKHNGHYYSDCSSSVSWAYKAAGYPIAGSSLPNTVGLYQNKNLKDVPVKISKGQITNPDVLRVGDLLLFAGSDSSRKYAGYVGHVEMVASISSSGKVTIYGHGSGTPRATEMTAYLKKRYKQKTSTGLGHKGLIKVRRLIWDDDNGGGNSFNVLENGMSGSDVLTLQKNLIKLGYSCGPDGADGDFGDNTEKAVKKFQTDHNLTASGRYDEATDAAMKKALNGDKEVIPADTGVIGTATARQDMHIRSGSSAGSPSIDIVKKGAILNVLEVLINGWYKVQWNGGYAYTSNSTGNYYTYTPNTPVKEGDEQPKSTDATLAGTYATTGSLNMRAGAGSTKKVLTVVPKGKKVECGGQYTEVDGTKWLYVKYQNCTGFCSMKYLKK